MIQYIDNSIRPYTVTTHSSNGLILNLCIDCLAKAKTNKKYRKIEIIPLLRMNKPCAVCFSMTIATTCTIYDIGALTLYQHVINEREFYSQTVLSNILFTPTYQTFEILKSMYEERMKHG